MKQIVLSGTGGQGLILAGIILAEAAVLDGKQAIQTQSYGPEARGGASKAGQVLIDGLIPYIHKYVFIAASGARLTLASLGNDAGAYGAFQLALAAFHA